MMTEQELLDAISELTQEWEDTKRQLADLPPGDPEDLAQNLEDDIDRLADEIESLEYDLYVVREAEGAEEEEGAG